MDQVTQYNPPPNPAKVTDSRANAYIAEFGQESWELDALEPQVISDLIRAAVEGLREEDKWEDKVEEETEARQQLTKVSNKWTEITESL